VAALCLIANVGLTMMEVGPWQQEPDSPRYPFAQYSP